MYVCRYVNLTFIEKNASRKHSTLYHQHLLIALVKFLQMALQHKHTDTCNNTTTLALNPPIINLHFNSIIIV